MRSAENSGSSGTRTCFLCKVEVGLWLLELGSVLAPVRQPREEEAAVEGGGAVAVTQKGAGFQEAPTSGTHRLRSPGPGILCADGQGVLAPV